MVHVRRNHLSNTICITLQCQAAAGRESPLVVLHCAEGGHGGVGDFAKQLAFLHKAVGLPLA